MVYEDVFSILEEIEESKTPDPSRLIMTGWFLAVLWVTQQVWKL